MDGAYVEAPQLAMERRGPATPLPVSGSTSPGSSGTGSGGGQGGAQNGNGPLGDGSAPVRSIGTALPRTPRISTTPIEDTVAPEESKPGSNAPVAFYGQVTVTWESAAPIRLARREPLGPEFAQHYAIRVTGLPPQTFMNDSGKTPAIFRLLTATFLDARAGRRELPDYVLRIPEQKALVFAFPTAGLRLSRADRVVSFTMNLNEMSIKVRFDPRQMTFRDLLAV
jgi:hypothetical protein